jgi:hypothetical protein
VSSVNALFATTGGLVLALVVAWNVGAQPFPSPPAPGPCVAARVAQADSLLAEKIAAVDRMIEAGQPGAWTALADLAQYSCAVTGDRLPADAAFRRCIRDCADERDVYFAHIFYAQTLERFDDVLGAENQYLQALQSREKPQDAYTAYMGYAAMLERHGRTRDALDVLNRFAGDWSYRSPPLQLKLSLMRALGMDTRAEEDAAKERSDADLVRTRLDSPPLSAIPVERNPLAQGAFGRTIEVVAEVWIEPAAEAGAPGPGRLVYRRASMPDPNAFARRVVLEPGQRFVAVADLSAAGCRVQVGDARYDLEECPWRTGRADANLFRVVDERTPLAPPVDLRPRPPVQDGEPRSGPASLSTVWQSMYRSFEEFERRGSSAYAESVLEQSAGLTPAEAAQVRGAGGGVRAPARAHRCRCASPDRGAVRASAYGRAFGRRFVAAARDRPLSAPRRQDATTGAYRGGLHFTHRVAEGGVARCTPRRPASHDRRG